jgi:hypothetical protein
MDQDLYDAAMDVMEAIEDKLATTDEVDEEVLGRNLAQKFRRWQSLALLKYIDPGPEPEPDQVRRPPPKKNHPWKGRAVLPKR